MVNPTRISRTTRHNQPVSFKVDVSNKLASIKNHPLLRISQGAVGMVFILNITCAFAFIFQPEKYMGGFEIGGEQGRLVVQALGILFLMWNATYPPVLIDPIKHKTLFGVVLLQQAIGFFGESWLLLTLPAGHAAITSTVLRFIYFDGGGLILMGLAYFLLMKTITAGVERQSQK
jgi:hypothetical protein